MRSLVAVMFSILSRPSQRLQIRRMVHKLSMNTASRRHDRADVSVIFSGAAFFRALDAIQPLPVVSLSEIA